MRYPDGLKSKVEAVCPGKPLKSSRDLMGCGHGNLKHFPTARCLMSEVEALQNGELIVRDKNATHQKAPYKLPEGASSQQCSPTVKTMNHNGSQ